MRIDESLIDFLRVSVQKRVPIIAQHAPRESGIHGLEQLFVQLGSSASFAANGLLQQSQQLGEGFGTHLASLRGTPRADVPAARAGRPGERRGARRATGGADRAAAGGRRRPSCSRRARPRGWRRRRARWGAALGEGKRGNRTLLVGGLEDATHGFEEKLTAVVGLGVLTVAKREETEQIALEELLEDGAGEESEVELGEDARVVRTAW